MADFCACDEFAMDDSPDSFGFISADAPFPIPITLGGTGAANSEVAAMNIIGPLPAVNALDEYDKVLIQQNSTAAIRKRRADAFAQDMWDMLYKDAEPIEDSTAPITSGAVYQALGGIFSPVKYATPGPLVHIEDGGYNQPIQGMKIAINPVQSGEGDPSPDNVRPISGWTAAKITRTGSNLVPPFAWAYSNTAKGVTFAFTPENVTITGTSTGSNADSSNIALASPLKLFAGQTYVFKIDGTWSTPEIRLFLRNAAYTNLWYGDSRDCTWTVSPSKDIEIDRIMIRVKAANATIDVSGAFYANLNELGAYEPYKGTTYEISFGTAGTVYGGYLIDNGDGTWTLTVENAGVDMGTLTWTYNASFATPLFASDLPGGKNQPTNGQEAYIYMCSAYTQALPTAINGAELGNNYPSGYYAQNGHATYCRVMCLNSAYTDAAAFKESVNGQTLVYKLAEPQTYTLTGPEVLTLLGINNIWADCGEIEELAYRADIGLYLTEALNPIKEMLAYREDTMRATRAYSAGDFIVVGDAFYKVAVPIANGATLTPGTNVNATTVGAQLKLLS